MIAPARKSGLHTGNAPLDANAFGAHKASGLRSGSTLGKP